MGYAVTEACRARRRAISGRNPACELIVAFSLQKKVLVGYSIYAPEGSGLTPCEESLSASDHLTISPLVRQFSSVAAISCII